MMPFLLKTLLSSRSLSVREEDCLSGFSLERPAYRRLNITWPTDEAVGHETLLLAATSFVTAAVAVAVDAIAAAIFGLPDEVADEATCDSADGCAAPAMRGNAADQSARTCADGRAFFRRRARRQCADEGDRDDDLLHDVSSLVLRGFQQ